MVGRRLDAALTYFYLYFVYLGIETQPAVRKLLGEGEINLLETRRTKKEEEEGENTG